MKPENLDIESLRKDIITHFENYVCSACSDSYLERTKAVAAADLSELIKTAKNLNFNLEKYKL